MDRTTEILSSFSCGLNYDYLTPQTVHQAKRVLVDTLACAMGGYLSEPAMIATQLARTVTSTLPSRIWGTKDYSSPDMAGFANSVMVRYLDYNDMSVGGHPSDSIPGALAMADYQGSDGRDDSSRPPTPVSAFGVPASMVQHNNRYQIHLLRGA